ncbi:MAG TPA: c-type cytochrome [Burkholderiales bacterium]|nr:c-type cytochrome [Burkholderiales bacterium]
MSRASLTALPLAVALALVSGVALAQSDIDPEEAKLAFNNHCRQCHVTREGDNRLGPSLFNVVGREAGSAPNYAYSSAMKNANLVWDPDNLDRYITNPDAVVPGNKMKPFTGISDAQERAKIIAHLESVSNGQ